MFSPEFVTGAELLAGELRIPLRLNWFRPLPLSCVEQLGLEVDGVAAVDAVLVLDGAEHAPGDLSGRDDVWWHTLSDAELRVPWPEAAPARVRVTLRTRIPLLVDHTGAPVTVVDSAEREVAA